MRAVFADTFYWIALLSVRDSAHDRAIQLNRALADELVVTTEPALIDHLNYPAALGPRFRKAAIETVRDADASPNIEIVPLTRQLFRAGLNLYGARRDKGYSLTDCISMIVMRDRRIEEALTNDSHFAQEGFKPLFRSSIQ
jgi:predicted nucleic acid-binding protein